ncbi:MAG: L-ascorbate metabolism protein UlaG, beta-lactamase superfamily [Patescibacteria group bacterium]|nr:hypothetical protein [Candidatus Saccharibacteria bacterium]MDQ5963117.1 L-ascorbate metabolism protein UlaG, beta-lactamase superfamily [Patescibacteria group bacterium]
MLKVDDFLYYPSNSYILTERQVQILALPTSGPRHKLSESVDLANTIRLQQILATHNGLYDNTGETDDE